MRGFNLLKTSGALLAGLASLSLVLATTVANAQPTLAQRTAAYGITGASPADLRAQMNSKGPVDQNEGRRYDAHTNTNIRWNVTWQASASGCQLTGVTTHVDVTYTMPNWLNSASANPVVRAKWEGYRASLMEHERGHARVAQGIANKIEAAIRAMGPKSSCPEILATANSIGYGILKSDRGHQEYDRATQHGRSQGAVWH